MPKNELGRPRFVSHHMQMPAIEAKYIDAELPSYRGNPNIETLPPMLEENEWADMLERRPDFDGSLRALRTVARRQLLSEFREKLYQPFSTSTEFALDFDTALRTGYVHRNPFDPEYRRKLLEQYDQLESKLKTLSDDQKANKQKEIVNQIDDDSSPADVLAVFGLSGMGKTRLVRRVLAYYLPKFTHGHYKDGRPLLYTQLTYLMFSCPPRGTLLEFAEDALITISEKLGKDYFTPYASQKGSKANTLLRGFLTVATEHYLGALVLDEVGNLYGAKEGKILQNFLLMLSNDFQIPVVLIGSPMASNLLTKNFRQLRRSSGSSEYNHWVQMEKDSENWSMLSQALFEYQVVRKPVKLTDKLQSKLHDISGGITDLAVKMFMTAQKQAMSDEEEKITPGLLQYVADKHFAWARPAVAALKLGTPQALRKYEDLYFENVKKQEYSSQKSTDETNNRSASKVSQPKESAEANAQSEAKKRLGDDAKSQSESETARSEETAEVSAKAETKNNEKKTRKYSRNKKKEPDALLLKIVQEGHKNNLSAYESLKKEGWIGSIQEYL